MVSSQRLWGPLVRIAEVRFEVKMCVKQRSVVVHNSIPLLVFLLSRVLILMANQYGYACEKFNYGDFTT